MIAENIKNIKENVEKTCFRIGKNPESVGLVAVSKTFSVEQIQAAMRSGVHVFGENYVQELLEKRKMLESEPILWHFIGHLQTNKVKYIAEWISMIHSVDSEGLVQEIQKRAEKIGRTIDVLMEVNTSAEATKFGVNPEKALDLLKKISVYPNVNVKGLMTIGPFTENKEESRQAFKLLKTIFNEANEKNLTSHPLTELSMGMTHDYEIAIEEGSTMIRIGTAIFGTRTKANE